MPISPKNKMEKLSRSQVAEWLARVALKVNLREHTSCTPRPNANKAAHSGF